MPSAASASTAVAVASLVATPIGTPIPAISASTSPTPGTRTDWWRPWAAKAASIRLTAALKASPASSGYHSRTISTVVPAPRAEPERMRPVSSSRPPATSIAVARAASPPARSRASASNSGPHVASKSRRVPSLSKRIARTATCRWRAYVSIAPSARLFYIDRHERRKDPTSPGRPAHPVARVCGMPPRLLRGRAATVIRATQVFSSGAWSHVATDTVVLDFDHRHRRRLRMQGEGGLDFLLDLPEAVAIRNGDGLAARGRADGRSARLGRAAGGSPRQRAARARPPRLASRQPPPAGADRGGTPADPRGPRHRGHAHRASARR